MSNKETTASGNAICLPLTLPGLGLDMEAYFCFCSFRYVFSSLYSFLCFLTSCSNVFPFLFKCLSLNNNPINFLRSVVKKCIYNIISVFTTIRQHIPAALSSSEEKTDNKNDIFQSDVI